MSRQKSKLVNFWITPDVYAKVQEKARQERINLSAFFRGVLDDWLAGQYSLPIDRERLVTERKKTDDDDQ